MLVPKFIHEKTIVKLFKVLSIFLKEAGLFLTNKYLIQCLHFDQRDNNTVSSY